MRRMQPSQCCLSFVGDWRVEVAEQLADSYLARRDRLQHLGICDGNLRPAPLVPTTLLVLTTFPIFYAIFMRNHRIIIGNVVVATKPNIHAVPQITHHTLYHRSSFSKWCQTILISVARSRTRGWNKLPGDVFLKRCWVKNTSRIQYTKD